MGTGNHGIAWQWSISIYWHGYNLWNISKDCLITPNGLLIGFHDSCKYQIRIYRGNLENSQKTSINDIRYFAEMKICMTCVIPGNVYFKHFS